ncbi:MULTISPECIES: beta-ketoacyl synthase N-terminal-like domain-containing protein [Streptomyces]|uniref:beta-ketoacyl synthase N-terminal-like domain-containing protein n=1 Tax=Streptomyces TaxID=1883 RepID=UPI00163D2C0E|nr:MULTISPECIES: beta-ketoacyl synthase N-terminal-like domain-containing protein [Streptomyces]MBC2875403.1 beta-ketoacyl-[acyl-carrier-protein] synthase family protein [Streptomyces sp. TYQ1024]UBI35646.1 beta-ketoacyl-[acyl-carrier-protein] synthase family protein [Streptomyces mobaraensis]UKW28239.1 beta-ketoacyl-[acyl-carrier-protein] synthase family protein [Streptomyces sp. TYQ1024]
MSPARRPAAPPRVAVTGVYLATGLGVGTEEVWRAVCAGDSALGRCSDLADVVAARLPAASWPGAKGVAGAPGAASAESTRAVTPPGDAESPETTGRTEPSAPTEPPDAAFLIRQAGRGALRHAALAPDSLDPYEIGLALGTNAGSEELWKRYRAATGPAPHPAHTVADELGAAVGARGPKAVFATGCVAGANAVGYAYDAVAAGRATVMLVGGYEALNVTTVATFASWKSIDSAPCAPYARSGGLSLGEAVAFLVLESEGSARARGVPVLAWLRGYGLTSDAHHITAPPPDGAGLRNAMLGALGRAGLGPDAVGYVNGHGTGTPANDTAELSAMRAVFTGPHPPPMSSSKPQVGHTLGACGAVEAVLTALALRDGLLPPTANADATPVWDVVPRTARRAGVRVALSNSIAFGGACCSLVLSRDGGEGPQPSATELVFTGAGVVSPLGLGRRAFLTALRGPAPAGPPRVPEDLAGHLAPGHRSRVDALGALTVAAARMAWDEAGLRDGARVGVVVATAAGPIGTVELLNETVRREGPEYVSAVHAPNIVTSVTAGYATLELGLGGPLSAVSTGDASGLVALGHAADLIRAGQADAVVVVAADEVTGTLARAFGAYGLRGPGPSRPYARTPAPGPVAPAAAAVVLEAAGHARARGADALGALLGHAVTSGPGRASGAPLCAETWSRALDLALRGLGPHRARTGGTEDVDVYGCAHGVPALDEAELAAVASCLKPAGTRLTALAGAVGHCQAAGPLLSLVAALDGCGGGRLPYATEPPDPLPGARAFLSDERAAGPRRALVTAASWGGTYAAAVVGPAGGER